MSRLWTLCNSIRKGLGGYRRPITTPNSSAFRSCSSSSSSSNFTRCLSSPSGITTKGGVQRIPWLVLPPTENGKILPVFSPSDRQFFEFTLPNEIQGPNHEIYGSAHGWIVLATNRIVILYNPITKAHIRLPLLPYYEDGGACVSAQIICNPTTAFPGLLLVSVLQAFDRILFYRQGDDHWAGKIPKPKNVVRILRILYHQAEAKLYALFDDGATLSVLNLASVISRPSLDDDIDFSEFDDDYYPLRPIIDTPSLEIESLNGLKHLMLAAGDLLLVVGRDWPGSDERPQYDIFKLDRLGKNGGFKWAREARIGDHTLFACRNHVVSMVCDPNFTDARANQIYHFKQHSKHKYEYAGSPDNNIAKVPADVRVWDIIDGANSGHVEQLSFTTSKILRQMSSTWYTKYAAWMVPSLELKDPSDVLDSDSDSDWDTTKRLEDIPWLILPPTENGKILPVFSPSDRCFLEFALPNEVQDPAYEIHGSAHGWIVLARNRKVALYNPITREHILLPLLPYYGDNSGCVGAQIICNPWKASPGRPMLSVIQGFDQILIYRQGEDYWSGIIPKPNNVVRIIRILYHEAEAKLYALYDDGARLAVLNLNSLIIHQSMSKDKYVNYGHLLPLVFSHSQEIVSLNGLKHLVLASGDLMLVVGRDWPGSDECPQYDVFKLDRIVEDGWEHFKWVKAASIGDHTLFACRNHVVSMICKPNFTDARANQIYHFKQHSKHKYEYMGSLDNNIVKVPADVRVWDIIDGANSDHGEQLSFTTSKILRQISPVWSTNYAAWMVPNLRLKELFDYLYSDSDSS